MFFDWWKQTIFFLLLKQKILHKKLSLNVMKIIIIEKQNVTISRRKEFCYLRNKSKIIKILFFSKDVFELLPKFMEICSYFNDLFLLLLRTKNQLRQHQINIQLKKDLGRKSFDERVHSVKSHCVGLLFWKTI